MIIVPFARHCMHCMQCMPARECLTIYGRDDSCGLFYIRLSNILDCQILMRIRFIESEGQLDLKLLHCKYKHQPKPELHTYGQFNTVCPFTSRSLFLPPFSWSRDPFTIFLSPLLHSMNEWNSHTGAVICSAL